MQTVQKRLHEFLEYLNMPMQTFERQCGIGQGLGAKLSNKSYNTTFRRISSAFPQLNIGWLKTGEGEMLNEPIAKINISHSPNSAASVNGNAIVYTTDEHELIRLREENRQLYERIAELKKINDYLMNNNKFPCS